MAHSTLASPYTGRLKVTIECLDDPENKLGQSCTFNGSIDGYMMGMYHHMIPLLGNPADYGAMVIDSRYTGSTMVISSIGPYVGTALKAVHEAQLNAGFGR